MRAQRSRHEACSIGSQGDTKLKIIAKYTGTKQGTRWGTRVGRWGTSIALGTALVASFACGGSDQPRESTGTTASALSEAEARAAYEAAKTVLLDVLYAEAGVAARAKALNIAAENATTIMAKNLALSQLKAIAPEILATQTARVQAQMMVHESFFSWRNAAKCGTGAFSIGFAWLSMQGTASAAEITRLPTSDTCQAIDEDVQDVTGQLADLRARIAAAASSCGMRAPDVCAAINAANQQQLDGLNARLLYLQMQFAQCVMSVATSANARCQRTASNGATCTVDAQIPVPGSPEPPDSTCPRSLDAGASSSSGTSGVTPPASLDAGGGYNGGSSSGTNGGTSTSSSGSSGPFSGTGSGYGSGSSFNPWANH